MPSVSGVVPEVLKRESRARRFGIDCASELRWHAKEPGGDYKQKLVLKNVSNAVIKFKFKLPQTSFFFMKFPDLVTLSPGMAASVDVCFRPIKKEVYDDVIEFITSNGSFFIRVVATLKEQGIKVQEYLDFGFATVQEESTKTFVLSNVGEVDSPFELLADSPFSVEPNAGMIKPAKSMTIKLKFLPTDASVYVGTVVVKQPDGPSLVMKVSGIGKLPHITVSEHLLDFGNVLLGQTKTQELILSNASLVPVSFNLEPLPHENDPAFQWNTHTGKLTADSSTALYVRFTPLATGAFNCEYFDIITPAGSHQRICCKGFGKPHDVKLGVTSINFGNLELGKVSMRTVEIVNHTNAQAFYQFITEPTGCFEFSRTDGTIIPESSTNVDIRFKARVPGNFYRRIFILIKNQGPLYLDLTATAYHQNQDQVPRPMPLMQKHVDNWRRRQLQEQTPHALAIRTVENTGDPVAEVWNEFFLDDRDSRRQVYVQDADIEFGAPAPTGLGEYKTITICNNTSVKQTAMFVIPPDNYQEQPEGSGEIKMTTLGPVLQPMETCFKVFPDKADILPRSSTTFKVAFRPVYENAYYSQSIEVFCFPKTQRNFRLVNDDNFCPPLCVTPVCSGNTFPPGMEAFTPKLRVPTTRINFPACFVNDKAYQVVEMYNEADTPLRFQLEQDPTGVFQSKPYNGLIMPHCVQLVAFMFNPTSAERYERTFTCLMNANPRHSVQFTLVGTGNSSAVTLETHHLQIKPTWMGAVSTRTCTIKNPGGVPVLYQWEVPESYSKVLAVEPSQGILRGNETHTLFWHFAPKKNGAYSMRIPVVVERAQVKCLGDTAQVKCLGDTALVDTAQDLANTMDTDGKSRMRRQERAILTVHGVGSGGIVHFVPETVDFGTLLVGNEVTKIVKVVNNSDSTMYFSMESNMPKNVSYKDGKGVLPAFATKRVTVAFTPAERMYYNVQIHCRLSTASEAAQTGAFGEHTGTDLLWDMEAEQMPTCQVLGNAVYPTLSVMDVRAEGMSSSRLWRELDFVEMNAELASDLTPTEIAWNKAEVDETDPSKVLKVMNVRFAVKHVEAPPSIKVLRVKNTGVLPLDFLLRYPRDDEDEPENWVDKDLQGIDEQTLNLILENKLFICEPRRGHLEVGEEVDLMLSYKHTFAGTQFKLPVILNVCELPPAGGVINTGKQIVMKLTGQTLNMSETRLQLPVADSRFYKEGEWGFQKTPIGLLNPPLQYYTFENTGTMPLDYQLNLDEMDSINRDNYGFDVFTCEDKEDGYLEPGESATIGFIFNPLEPKVYTFSMEIHVVGGETRMVQFLAEGVHQDPHLPLRTTVWPLPLMQVMPLPNQQVFMAYERFVLGDMPVGAEVHRMIMLINKDQEQSMEFAFDTNNKLAAQFTALTPSFGEIPPSEFVVVRLTVKCMVTSIFDFDIKCAVQPKPPDVEENEDLADEGAPTSPIKSTKAPTPTGSSRPWSAETSRTSGTSATAAAQGKGRGRTRKRTSVLDLPPPPRGIHENTGGQGGRESQTQQGAAPKGTVTFNVESNKGETRTKMFDDGASVASAKTARTAVTMANASTVALGLSHGGEEEVPDMDYSLHISLQAHVRMPEEHQQLFGNIEHFRFPKVHGQAQLKQGMVEKQIKAANNTGGMLGHAGLGQGSPTLRPQHGQAATSSHKGGDGRTASAAGQVGAKAEPWQPGGAQQGGAANPLSMLARGGSQASMSIGGQSAIEKKQAQDNLKRDVTGAVLEQLVNDVLRDDDVLGVLDDLELPVVPTFVQMAHRPPTPFRLGTPDDASQPMVRAGVDVPGHSAQILEIEDEETEEKHRARIRKLTMATTEFENLAAFVIDACLFNHLEEVAFGEETLLPDGQLLDGSAEEDWGPAVGEI